MNHVSPTKQFMRLIGIQLNQRYGLTAMRIGFREDKAKTIRNALIVLVGIIAIGSLVFMYAWLAAKLYEAFAFMHMESVMLSIAMLVSMVLVLVLGLFYLIGTLYFAKDTEFLLTLPIPSRTVYLTRFLQVLMGELLTAAITLLPILVLYGIKSEATAMYYVRAALVLLLSPCIPLSISAVLSLFLMRGVAMSRHRDLLTIVGAVLLMIGSMVVQMRLSTAMPEVMDQSAMLLFLQDHANLLTRVSSLFPPSGWAAKGLLGDGMQLLLFAIVSLAALLLVGVLSQHMYQRAATAQLESGQQNTRVRMNQRAFKQKSSLYALFLREWRLVLRSPIYVLNGLAMIVMGPLLLFMPRLMGNMPTSPGDISLNDMMAQLSSLSFLPFAIGCAISLLGMMNIAAFTSVSREGKCFYMLRMQPISPRRQALAKFLFGYSVLFLAALIMAGIASYTFSLSLLDTAYVLLLPMCLGIAPLALGMMPDFIRPKLSWNSETEAIKQNMNGVLGMVIGLLYCALLAIGGYFLSKLGISFELLQVLVIGASILLGGASIYALFAISRHIFVKIEG